MPNFNKVILAGHLTRDVEVKTFQSGAKVAKGGIAVNNRRKNQQTGQYDDEPVFLDWECFQGGQGKMADLLAANCHKGSALLIEGHLRQDSWEKDGQKRSKLLVVVDGFQFLGAKGGNGAPADRGAKAPAPQGVTQQDEEIAGDIPF